MSTETVYETKTGTFADASELAQFTVEKDYIHDKPQPRAQNCW